MRLPAAELVAPATLARLHRLRSIAHAVLNQHPGMTYAEAFRAAGGDRAGTPQRRRPVAMLAWS